MGRLFKGIGRIVGRVAAILRGLINLVFVLFFIVLLVNLFSGQSQPMPDRAALYLAPAGQLVDQRSYIDPVTQALRQAQPENAETVVSEVVQAIDAAAEDERIPALVLHTDYLFGGGVSKLTEIGDALLRFRATGKPVIAHGASFTQDQYYLASHADEIHLDPMGGVLLTGLGSYPLYYRDALDKLKVQLNVFRVGEYKDAVEPFTRTSMSPESRQHNSEWIRALWQYYTDRMETQRKLPAGSLQQLTETLPDQLRGHGGSLAQLALETGLVDHLSGRNVVQRRLIELVGADPETDDYLHVEASQYLLHQQRARAVRQPLADKVAIVTAAGVILDGPQPLGTIGSLTVRELLEQVREDDSIRALVLRIDSPGGSAFASEEIRRDLVALRQQRQIPIVVSMGSVAASGGYWIAADADLIYAQPTTLTGSIGVFGIVPTFEQSLEALGIHSDGISTSPLADLFHLQRPMGEAARDLIQLEVEGIYNRFIELVSQGRQLEPMAVRAVAEGRVWTGATGVQLGLVDQLGDLNNAIEAAAGLAGLESYEVEHISKPLSFGEQLLMHLSGNMVKWGLAPSLWYPESQQDALSAKMLTTLTAPLRELSWLNDPHNLYLRCFECGAL